MWESTKMWRKSGKQIGRMEKLENSRMKNEEDYSKWENNKMEEWENARMVKEKMQNGSMIQEGFMNSTDQ